MIFAELEYDQHYANMHRDLVEWIQVRFLDIQHGLQGDSWIWIFDGNDKVEIDTFSSMKHQIKCACPNNDLLKKVLRSLSEQYSVHVYPAPEVEPHEDL